MNFDENKIDFSNLKTASSELQMLIYNKRINVVTELIADHLKKTYHFKSIRNDKDMEIWVYIQGIYVPNGRSYIIEFTREMLDFMFTTYLGNQVVAKIYADTFIDEVEFFNQQNEYTDLIVIQNGIYDYKKKQLLNFTPELYFFTKVNAIYDPSAKCPKIIKFLEEVLNSNLDVLTIQEIFGFSLIRDYKYEKGFMFYGERGRNGKSKILEILKRFLGVENCASVSLQDLEKEQFSIINLHNKLVNIAADIPNAAVEHTGIYKSLTGRDLINANRKGQTHIKFVNYAKMIFGCNELPLIRTLSNAFWLRWVMINFPYQFLPQNEIDSLDNKENVFLQDKDIISKISTQEELNGLLNWSLEGLYRLLKTNKFSNETNSNEVKKYWLKKSNSVVAFINEMIEIDYDSSMTKSDFRKHYHLYCKRENINQMSDKAIKITLAQEMGISESYMKTDNIQQNSWIGIKFKTELYDDQTSIIKKMFEQSKELTLSQLNNLIPNYEKLIKILNILESEGTISQARKGLWRLNEK